MAGTGLANQNIGQLILSTLAAYKDVPKFEAALDFQEYYFVDQVFRRNNYQEQSGTQVEFRCVLDNNGSARHTRLFQQRTDHNKRDLITRGVVPWVYADAEAVYEAHILTMNRGESVIVNEIKTEYFATYASLLKIIEERAVGSPDSSTDDLNPQGLGHIFGLFAGTNYTGGFLGQRHYYGDGTNTTSLFGIDSATQPMWRNPAANRTPTLDAGTMDTMRYLSIISEFKTPNDLREYYSDRNMRRRVLWSQNDHAAYERLVNLGPDDRNGDLNPFRGAGVTWRGLQCVPLATMNNDTYNRIYVVDFSYIFPVIHGNWWMREDEPIRDQNQRHVWTVGIDCQYAYGCDNLRRAGFVLFNPIAA
ncbi:MAG: hypothetical protein SFZ23_08670 [Planctomycetota bacterium]|nr:hypothetical protein [Planctomycetota bacterium]